MDRDTFLRLKVLHAAADQDTLAGACEEMPTFRDREHNPREQFRETTPDEMARAATPLIRAGLISLRADSHFETITRPSRPEQIGLIRDPASWGSRTWHLELPRAGDSEYRRLRDLAYRELEEHGVLQT